MVGSLVVPVLSGAIFMHVRRAACGQGMSGFCANDAAHVRRIGQVDGRNTQDKKIYIIIRWIQ